MDASSRQVWTMTTPIQKGAVTSIDLPDIDPHGRRKISPPTFVQIFAEGKLADLVTPSDGHRDGKASSSVGLRNARVWASEARDMSEYNTDPAVNIDIKVEEDPLPLRGRRSSLGLSQNFGQLGIRHRIHTSPEASQVKFQTVDDDSPEAAIPIAQDDHAKDRRATPLAPEDNILSLQSPDGLLLELMNGPIRRSKLRVRWYHLRGTVGIPRPPTLSTETDLEIGDIFLHSYRSASDDKVIQVWILGQDDDGTIGWKAVLNASKIHHPILSDRVLSFQNVSTPTWVSPNTECRHVNKPIIVLD